MRVDFNQLPLLETQIQILFKEPISVGHELVMAVRDRLRYVLPVPTITGAQPMFPNVEGNMVLAFGVPSATGVFTNPETGLQASIGVQGIAITWRKPFFGASLAYPRYETLRGIAEPIVQACEEQGIGNDRFNNGNLTYVNYVSTDGVQDSGTILKFIDPAFIPSVTHAAPILFDFNYSFRLRAETDWDWRIQVNPAIGVEEPGEQRGFFLVTSGGATIHDHDNVLHAVDAVHDRMQELFLSAITEEAKKLWQLQ